MERLEQILITVSIMIVNNQANRAIIIDKIPVITSRAIISAGSNV